MPSTIPPHPNRLLDLSIRQGVLTAEDQKAAGMDIHAGCSTERHNLGGLAAYRQCAELAWLFWRAKLAKASCGTALAGKFSATAIALALRIPDGEDVDAAA